MKHFKLNKIINTKAIFFCCLILLITTNNFGVKAQNEDTNKLNLKRDTVKNIFPDTISIIGVGDIMLGTNYPSKRYLPPQNNCYPLLENVKNILQNAHLTVGNLEGCFSDTAPLVKRCKDTTKCYAFRMPISYSNCLKDAGFDVLTLANNHSGDFGDLGRQTTVNTLDTLFIIHAGLAKYPYAILQKENVRYGIASFSPNRGTVSIHDTLTAKKIVKKLKKSVDIVIVTFHAGAEGSKHQHITRKNEFFYGENRGNVYQFARIVIDAGADVVFGHGPHVPRAIDLYKNRFIAYSLGNFCTYGRFNLSGPNGIAPIVKINIDKNGVFLDGNILSAKQLGGGGTYLDNDRKAVKIIQMLTKTDIPECPLIINDDGYFYRLPEQKK